MTSNGLNAEIRRTAATLGVLGDGGSSAPRILAALFEVGVTAGTVATMIAGEPGLMVRVLRVANSSFFGQPHGVATVEHAIRLLGFDAVRNIAAATCFDRFMLRTSRDAPVDVGILHRHSVATAVAADSIARVHHPHLAPLAFVAGLLHDLGVVIQMRIDPTGIRELMRLMGLEPQLDAITLESRRIKVPHEQCIAVALEGWGFPRMLVEATRFHHHPDQAPAEFRQMAALIRLSDHLAHLCEKSFDYELAPKQLEADSLEWLGLSIDDWTAVASAFPQRLAEFEQAHSSAR